MRSSRVFPQSVVFATTVFDHGLNGPETYARYLWEAFRDDPEIEFHVVAPVFPAEHARWHPSGEGTGSLDLYRRNAQTALRVAQELGSPSQKILVHVNNSNLHRSLLAYSGPLWGQVNDYENVDLWRRAGQTLRQAGLRRFLALARRRWLERRFIARQDISLCNSDFTRQKILSEYRPSNPERILTLHKAVDVAFFKRPAQLPTDPFDRPSGVRRFVFVGSDFMRKGLDVLLRAVMLLPTGMEWHLTIVGATQEQVGRAWGDLSLSTLGSRVLYAGRLEKEQLRQVLWNSNVFVLPSRAEALGVAILEALAAGLPVVATRVGGIPEIMRDPTAGILVPPDDPAALAEALAKIQPWRQGSPPAPVEEILRYFSSHAMTSRLRDLYLQFDRITI